MFNLKRFLPKKEAILNKDNILEDMPKAVSKAIYPKEVLEIHHEFETASDRLLESAKSIVAEANSKDTSKVIRLEALGFKNAAQVTEVKPLIKKAQLSLEQVRFLEECRVLYPGYKFINEEQVAEICFKYNLVLGSIGGYKGFVPEKNLKEIEKFVEKYPIKDTIYTSNGLILENAEVRRNPYAGEYEHIFIKGTNKYAFQRNGGEERFYSSDAGNIFGLAGRGSMSFTIVSPFKICAPVKDMDMRNHTIENGYKIKKHIPDPVVLHPVKHGYLIITAWGDEASDPLVVNETMN